MSSGNTKIYQLRERNFRREYYVDAFFSELDWVWGRTPFQADIESMCQFRAMAISVKRSHKATMDSRRMLFHRMTEFKSDYETDLINLFYKQLPTGNFIGKYLQNVATNYKWAPKRSFGEKGAQDELFTPIYEEGKINTRFRRAHILARVMNSIAVRPVVRKGVQRVQLVTPDVYRVETDPDDEMVATAIWYPITIDGNTVLQRWDAQYLETIDRRNGRVISREPNKYGELPFCFLRLEESEDFYGGGDFELIDSRMEANDQRFYANLSAKYESHGVALATNLGLEDDQQPQFGPGTVIAREGIGEAEGEAPPSIEFVSPQGQYTTLDELRKARVHEILRMRGVPNSNLTENPGQPASGRAREIEREELNDIREEDSEPLITMERDFKRILAITRNADLRESLPVDRDLLVGYQREEIKLEVNEQYEYKKGLMTDFVISPTDFVNEFTEGDQRMTPSEVKAYIHANKKEYDDIFGAVKPPPVEPDPNGEGDPEETAADDQAPVNQATEDQGGDQ